jgi:HSP20 family molecular chaperone IbpA
MTRWDPASDLQSLSSLMSRFLEGFGDAPPVLDGAFIPAADIEETDDAFIIEVELPGINKKDVDVSLSGRRLTISGERKEKERTGVLRRRVRSMAVRVSLANLDDDCYLEVGAAIALVFDGYVEQWREGWGTRPA